MSQQDVEGRGRTETPVQWTLLMVCRQRSVVLFSCNLLRPGTVVSFKLRLVCRAPAHQPVSSFVELLYYMRQICLSRSPRTSPINSWEQLSKSGHFRELRATFLRPELKAEHDSVQRSTRKSSQRCCWHREHSLNQCSEFCKRIVASPVRSVSTKNSSTPKRHCCVNTLWSVRQ